MRRAACPLAFAALLALAPPTEAGKFNKTLKVGDAAPAWEKLEGTDGKPHALADLAGKDVVVVVFTTNTCLVAENYEDRIVAFAATHAGADSKVGVVAINVNTGPDDALPAMKVRAAKKKFPFLYLSDPTQETAKKYGAQYTPEFFVLDKDRKVAYLGAMDEKGPPADPGAKHLEKAVAAVLAGKKPDTAETLGRGCRVKYVDKK